MRGSENGNAFLLLELDISENMLTYYMNGLLAAKRAAIKAIHCYPQNLEPWSVLLAAEAALDDVLPSGTM